MEGGQNVEATLGTPREIPLGTEIFQRFGLTYPAIGYPIERMVVNGHDQLNARFPVFFHQLTQNQYFLFQDQTELLPRGVRAVARHIGFQYSPLTNAVILSSMIRGEDLAAYYHERGHGLDAEFKRKNSLLIRIFHLIQKLDEKSRETAAEQAIQLWFTKLGPVQDIWKWIIEREKYAHSQAVHQVIQEKESGNNLYPNDPNLLRLRKYQGTMILGYLSLFKGELAKKLPPPKKSVNLPSRISVQDPRLQKIGNELLN